MNHLELLFSQNASIPCANRVIINNGAFVFECNERFFSYSTLRNMIGFVNAITTKYRGVKLPIVFNLHDVQIVDKLIYILFECICEYLIVDCSYKVLVNSSVRDTINTEGIRSSPIQLLTTGKIDHQKKFKDKFKFDIYKCHYRRLLTESEICKTDLSCVVLDEIAQFQRMFNVDDDCREAISEVLIELVGNAGEHGHSDCLIDFDIAPDYIKEGSSKEYVGINIALLNFSKELLCTSLKDKILNVSEAEDRYKVVTQAYLNHSKYFSQDYYENDFFNITAFQHKISGRPDNTITGGTGLTKLIESLETKSDAHMCYVATGNSKLRFQPEYLKYNKDGWIGFNDTNNYVDCCPKSELIVHNEIYIPGTAYNLNFVMQRKE